MRDPSLRALRVLGLSAVLRPLLAGNYPYTVLRPVSLLRSLLSPTGSGLRTVSLALARLGGGGAGGRAGGGGGPLADPPAALASGEAAFLLAVSPVNLCVAHL